MEMLNGNRRPVCSWETSGMEEDSECPCCCGEEGRLHRQNSLIRLLHRREKRLTRMAHFLAVALLLVISVALALLLALLLGRSAPDTPDSQLMMHRETNSSVISSKQQQHEIADMYPSAMLTAPNDNFTVGKCLQWQSTLGNAYCDRGFNYSNGNLVVPRHGKYKVFLQITYESDPNKCHGQDEIRLSTKVSVFREAYPKDTDLLSSFDTVNCSMNNWSKSLYTAGLFDLPENSKLCVTISHPELIVKREELTFFGVELQHSMRILGKTPV
ncbi:tumor necrosis factor ligand superfamily member 15-like [Thunnus maccoyii]|uniref:tumor necrosis factor ligand superfamily member 15-like n=1 Tax=Thunnus maccoyii TaxID=8240 RepID=UPI001C4B4339|nr:tumor necrosis factor ligand superfamily member 15-like [Thunnus maccoyii]